MVVGRPGGRSGGVRRTVGLAAGTGVHPARHREGAGAPVAIGSRRGNSRQERRYAMPDPIASSAAPPRNDPGAHPRPGRQAARPAAGGQTGRRLTDRPQADRPAAGGQTGPSRPSALACRPSGPPAPIPRPPRLSLQA